MTHTHDVPRCSIPCRPPRPIGGNNAGHQIAWLIDIDNQPGYWPLNDKEVYSEGAILPFKKIIDPETGVVRGRFATVAEEKECRAGGFISPDETVAFLLDYPRSPDRGTFTPEEVGIAYRIKYLQINELISLDGIDHERAKRFTGRGIARRFKSGNPYTLTTLNAESVLWAAITIRYKARVGLNTKRLMHFRNSEALDPLVSLGARFYTAENYVTFFMPFRQPVPVNEVRELEPLVEFSFGLERHLINGIRRSYIREGGEIDCVPGPHSGELFDPRTGERLPDEAWGKTPLINQAILSHVRYEGRDPVRKGPNEAQATEILKACGLTRTDRWGKRDKFVDNPGREFALVIPGKIYQEDGNSFIGANFTSHLYAQQLQLGREFFANVYEQENPRWLCVDFDVQRADDKAQRVCVDRAWLNENLDWEMINRWESYGAYPEIRLSGRGFYVELFLSRRVERETLKEIVTRIPLLIRASRHELHKGQRVHSITPNGYRVIRDITNLSHLVRMPGSIHHSVGFSSCYLDGSFVPPSRRSSSEGVQQILATETPSIYTPPSSSSSFSSNVFDYRKSTKPHDQKELQFEYHTSVEWTHLRFTTEGRLFANKLQRKLLVDLIVETLISIRGRRRGPKPQPAPLIAATSCLIDQCCRTSGPFYFGTKQIQLRISEVQGYKERARNRASNARKALEVAGYIRKVEQHIRRGDSVAPGLQAHRSHAAKYEANMEKLVAMMKEAWRKHRGYTLEE